MLTLRSAAGALALGFLLLISTLPEAAAQGKGNPPGKGGGLVDGYDCPKCGKEISAPNGAPPSVCPFCGAKLEAVKNADGTYHLAYTETSENKLRKPLIIGGGVLLVLGLIGVALKYTVFAPAKPTKKKRRDDDDDDDRPRKKKRPVVDDDDDDRPRKAKKKPRIVDEDDD